MPYERRPDLEPLALRDPLWRYMDFTKFVAMLVNKTLYLRRVDKLGDAFEGAFPPIRKRNIHGFFREIDYQRYRDRKQTSGDSRRRHYVICWHGSDTESDAMAHRNKSATLVLTHTACGGIVPDHERWRIFDLRRSDSGRGSRSCSRRWDRGYGGGVQYGSHNGLPVDSTVSEAGRTWSGPPTGQWTPTQAHGSGQQTVVGDRS